MTQLSQMGKLKNLKKLEKLKPYALQLNIQVPFILFFNLLSEIRNKAKGQTLRFIFVTDDRLTLVYITFMK